MAVRLFRVVADGCGVCILVALWYFTVGTHVVCLRTLLLVRVAICRCYSSALTSLLTHAFWGAYVHGPHGHTPRSGIAGSADMHISDMLALYKFLMSWQHSEHERVSIKIRVTALPSKCKDSTIWDLHSTSVTGVLVPPQSSPNLPHAVPLGFWRHLDLGTLRTWEMI